MKTWVVRRGQARRRLRASSGERLREGRQCFVVCPLVEESEALQAPAATAEAKRLAAGEFAAFEVAVMHGQMHARDKRAAMARFASGEVDVLVATSVIEVGIDVPNACVIVIEEADRYGISQLHQLRGRVGRGEHESYCLLFSGPHPSPEAVERLAVLARTTDGFEVAEADLALGGRDASRGRDGVLAGLRLSDLVRDRALLADARGEARADHRRRSAVRILEHLPLRAFCGEAAPGEGGPRRSGTC